MNDVNGRKIEIEHDLDAERARAVILQEKLAAIAEENERRVSELEQTTNLRYSQETQRLLSEFRQEEARRLAREQELSSVKEQLEMTQKSLGSKYEGERDRAGRKERENLDLQEMLRRKEQEIQEKLSLVAAKEQEVAFYFHFFKW